MAVPISIKNVQPGWMLEERILTDDGRVLLNPTILTAERIKKLQAILLADNTDYYVNVGIANPNSEQEAADLEALSKQQEEERVRLLEQDFDINDFVGKVDRGSTIRAIQASYKSSEKDFEASMQVVNDCVKKITYEVQVNPNFSYSLGQYNKVDANDVSEHSYRVAQFSVVLAHAYNQAVTKDKEINLDTIGVAALLHDYGTKYSNPDEMKKLSSYTFNSHFLEHYPKLDKDLLTKPYDDQYRTIYAYVKLKDFLNSSATNMILHSGDSEKTKSVLNYKPDNLDSNPIIGAKIINICSLYDYLLCNVIYKGMGLENVSTVMDKLAVDGVINPRLYALFTDTIPLYSVGVRVELSNGQYATVVARHKGALAAWPIVKTLTNDKEDSKIIDLSDPSNNVTVKRIVASKEHISQTIAKVTEGQLKTTNVTVFDPVISTTINQDHKYR